MSAQASSSSSKHAASLSTHAVATETPLPGDEEAIEHAESGADVQDNAEPQEIDDGPAAGPSGPVNGLPDASPLVATDANVGDTALEEHADDEETHDDHDPGSSTRVANLEADLDRVTDEKNKLESQYRNLLGKLTNMRNTLGDKLRQDAVSQSLSHKALLRLSDPSWPFHATLAIDRRS